jgi:Glycosyl transferase family 11
VTKSFASSFFTSIYCPTSNGHQTKCRILQTDAAFEKSFFKDRSDHPYLIGYQYTSPQAGTHRGLFYQHRIDDYYDVFQYGTALLINKTYEVNSSFCYSHEWTGRLGNLMFQYASLLGQCVLHNYPLHSCIGINDHSANNEVYLPLKKFISSFRIPRVNCKHFDTIYTEHEDNIYAIKYDDILTTQEGGTKILGYLQSFKYFHPHASVLVKRTFSFSTEVMAGAENYLASLKKEESLVCVSVRRGDKVNNNFYSQWAISADYYIRAINLLSSSSPILNSSALLFFVGGGVGDKEISSDRRWMETILYRNLKGGSLLWSHLA